MDLIEQLKKNILQKLQSQAKTSQPTALQQRYKPQPVNVRPVINKIVNTKMPMPGVPPQLGVTPKQAWGGVQAMNTMGPQIATDLVNRAMRAPITTDPRYTNIPNSQIAKFRGQQIDYFRPTTGVEKFFFGDQKIAPLTRDIQSVSDKLQGVGLSKNIADPTAMGIGAAYLVGNITTGGKGKAINPKTLVKIQNAFLHNWQGSKILGGELGKVPANIDKVMMDLAKYNPSRFAKDSNERKAIEIAQFYHRTKNGVYSNPPATIANIVEDVGAARKKFDDAQAGLYDTRIPSNIQSALSKKGKIVKSTWGDYQTIETEIPVKGIMGAEPSMATSRVSAGKKVTKPIEVVYTPNTKEWTVVDGNHRLAQARANGQQTIKARVGVLTDDYKNGDLIGNTDLIEESLKSRVAQQPTKPAGLYDTTVYHGTKANFKNFSNKALDTGKGDSYGATWFTNNADEAQAIAENVTGKGTPRVVQATLKTKKPYFVDVKGEVLLGNEKQKAIDFARKNGYDSVVFKNSKITNNLNGDQIAVLNNKIINQSRVAQQPVDDIAKVSKGEEMIQREKNAIDEFEAMLNAPEEKVTQIADDAASIQRAEAEALRGKSGFSEFGGLSDEAKQGVADWINQRKASVLEGQLMKKVFAKYDEMGLDAVFSYQKGKEQFKDVAKFFDDKFDELKKAGVKMGFKEDYLPQLWDNTPEEIQRVFGRKLSERASFQNQSIFKTYQEGIEAGLTPKFQTIGELAAWYEGRANRLLADKKFFDRLGKDGMILPAGRAPEGWVTLDADRFPTMTSTLGDGKKYSGVYKAPEELANMINNYLGSAGQGSWKYLDGFAKYVTRVKNMTLNFGIPFTGINMHGINEMARHTIMGTGSNPVGRFLQSAEYMAFPSRAQAYLDKNIARIGPRAMRAGLTMSAEDYSGLGKVAENVVGAFSNKWEQAFATPLFNKMIPAMKLSSWEHLVKNGMKERDAATLVNNVYGGINWEAMGRNRDVQNFWRAIVLTPDWGESTLKIGGNFVKAFNPSDMSKVTNRYRTMMATLVASYVGHNIVNKITSGHYSYENDPGHIFEIELGYSSSGQKRYLRPYGTALDMVRLPAEAAIAVAKGDYSYMFRALRNRMSIPAGSVIGMVTDQDYRGQKIGWRGKDTFGGPLTTQEQFLGSSKNAGIVPELAGFTGFPQFGRQFLKTAMGSQGLEEGLTQGFELPFRYSGGAYTENQKQMEKIAKDAGIKGQDLYEFNQSIKGIRFGENEKKMIQQGGYPALSNLIRIKTQEKAAKEGTTQEEPGFLSRLFGGPQAEASTEESGDFVAYLDSNGDSRVINLTKYNKTAATPKAKAELASERYADAKELVNIPADQLSDEKKNQYLEKIGVTREDAEYYAVASENNAFKAMYVRESIAGMNREEMMNQLIQWRKNVQNKYILASGVIDTLVDEGILSSAEGKQLKNLDITKQANGKYKAKMSGRGSGATLKKVKFVQNKINTKAQKLEFSDTISETPQVGKIKFPTPQQFGNLRVALPKSPTYKVKFNV